MSKTAILMDVKRCAVHDGPGIRTTLFLKGCPLKCLWCHNPEGISAKPQLAYYGHKCINCGECVDACPSGAHAMIEGRHVFHRGKCIACGVCESVCLGGALKLYGRAVSVGEAKAIALEDRAFFRSDGGVTLSGGEPLLQADFCFELLSELKREGIHTAVDTCGFVRWEAYEKILPVTDMFLFDIKHSDDAEHKRLAGQGNRLILANLSRLSSLGARIEVRMPLIPGLNDSEKNIHGTGVILGKLKTERMIILPYHSLARSKYVALGMTDTMPEADMPSADDVRHAVDIIRGHGVNAVSGLE